MPNAQKVKVELVLVDTDLNIKISTHMNTGYYSVVLQKVVMLV